MLIVRLRRKVCYGIVSISVDPIGQIVGCSMKKPENSLTNGCCGM